MQPFGSSPPGTSVAQPGPPPPHPIFYFATPPPPPPLHSPSSAPCPLPGPHAATQRPREAWRIYFRQRRDPQACEKMSSTRLGSAARSATDSPSPRCWSSARTGEFGTGGRRGGRHPLCQHSLPLGPRASARPSILVACTLYNRSRHQLKELVGIKAEKSGVFSCLSYKPLYNSLTYRAGFGVDLSEQALTGGLKHLCQQPSFEINTPRAPNPPAPHRSRGGRIRPPLCWWARGDTGGFLQRPKPQMSRC